MNTNDQKVIPQADFGQSNLSRNETNNNGWYDFITILTGILLWPVMAGLFLAGIIFMLLNFQGVWNRHMAPMARPQSILIIKQTTNHAVIVSNAANPDIYKLSDVQLLHLYAAADLESISPTQPDVPPIDPAT